MNELTGPVIHVAVSAALSRLFRTNLVVTVLCGILPDLVDKPLHLLGIGGGRFIGHTLLFAAVVVTLLTLKDRRLWFSALLGLASHLVLDLNDLVPWFWPFVKYDFSEGQFSVTAWLAYYVSFRQLGIEAAVAVAAIALVLFLRRALRRRQRRQGQKNTASR